MANKEHLEIIRLGVLTWNQWRKENPKIKPDLSGAYLRGANLSRANLSRADLHGANLRWADLSGARLGRADLREADLTAAGLVQTDLESANLSGCKIYGISAWGIKLKDVEQRDLVITPPGEPMITVDNLEVAQFIYLLLYSEKIRSVIDTDTITAKVVLILGRFTPKRKALLDAIREELRTCNYLPVLVDFQKPATRDLTETISTLAHMARFVIADFTGPRSIPQELERIVPDLPSLPVQPLLQEEAKEYQMFKHFKTYPWVLPIYRYRDLEHLRATLKEKVISPAEKKVKELRGKG